jgi:hypothetical protein
MDPSEPSSSIAVLLGDESSVFMGNVAGSIPPAMLNGNLYTNGEASPSNVLLSFPVHAR